MQNYELHGEREHFLSECIKNLDTINKRIAKLLLTKEELTRQIIAALGHEHEGQKSYDYLQWRIEVKTPCIYSLNKKVYEACDYIIPQEFNPIKQSISYSIDKKMCDEIMETAPQDVRDILAELIDKKPGKATVAIKERSQ